MSHTPTPWRVDGGPRMKYIESSIGNGRVQEVATCMICEYGDLEANARRIAACVNACDGIDTEKLESGGLGCVLAVGLEDQKRADDAEVRLAALHTQPVNWPAAVIVLMVVAMIYLTWGVAK